MEFFTCGRAWIGFDGPFRDALQVKAAVQRFKKHSHFGSGKFSRSASAKKDRIDLGTGPRAASYFTEKVMQKRLPVSRV
jgi:hypothetical protein